MSSILRSFVAAFFFVFMMRFLLARTVFAIAGAAKDEGGSQERGGEKQRFVFVELSLAEQKLETLNVDKRFNTLKQGGDRSEARHEDGEEGEGQLCVHRVVYNFY